MPANFPNIVRPVFPGASNETIARIQAAFAVKEGEPPERLAWDWMTAVGFGCNAWALAGAYREIEAGRRYVVTAPPAVHGLDIYCEYPPFLFPLHFLLSS